LTKLLDGATSTKPVLEAVDIDPEAPAGDPPNVTGPNDA